MTSEETSFDQDKARAFVRTMATIMNSGSLMIMTSI
jgi:hypothetical protein